MDGENFTSTMKRTVKGRWKAFKKRWSSLLRRLGSSKTDAGRCHCPKNGGMSAPARRFDDEQSDDWSGDSWDSDYDRQGDDEQGNSKTFRQRIVELRLKRANLLYAISKKTNEQTVTRLCDAKHENFRLRIAARELEAKLCEATARAEKLEAELLASHAVASEQEAVTNSSIAENRRLNAAFFESSRLTEAMEQRAQAAELRAEECEWHSSATKRLLEAAEQRAKVAERRVVVMERRIVVTERRARAAERRTERRARAAERQAEAARRRTKQGVEQRPALSSAIADLQGVMSSPLAELRIDVLQATVEKLQRVLEANTDERTVEYDRTDHCDGDDEVEDDEHDL